MTNYPNDTIGDIRGMRLPPLFVELWNSGKWRQPQEKLIQQLIPWLNGPVEFIEEMQWLELENSGQLADIPFASKMFQEYHGNNLKEKPDLPWLDIDQALFIAVNREHGDDLGIAIDFRTSLTDPRVVASRWCSNPHHVEWDLVTDTFSEFVHRLEMKTSSNTA